MVYHRALSIELPSGQSAFLRGPRKTGKSTLLRQRFPQAARFDLLDTRLLLELTRRPWALRDRVQALDAATRALPIVVNEVQKTPALLDEVHWLIENAGLRFVLCGSSARKLKRGRANLLGGRAWRFGLHPLTWTEIPTSTCYGPWATASCPRTTTPPGHGAAWPATSTTISRRRCSTRA